MFGEDASQVQLSNLGVIFTEDGQYFYNVLNFRIDHLSLYLPLNIMISLLFLPWLSILRPLQFPALLPQLFYQFIAVQIQPILDVKLWCLCKHVLVVQPKPQVVLIFYRAIKLEHGHDLDKGLKLDDVR